MTDERDASLRVLILAGYPALRAGLAALLANEPGIETVEDRAPLFGIEPLEVSELDSPDAIVADAVSIGDAALDDIHERFPAAPLVLIGAAPSLDEPGAFDLPIGYLTSDVDGPALAAAVRAVSQGLTVIAPGLLAVSDYHPSPLPNSGSDLLTPREKEVLALVANGLPNKAIARELGISEHTAKFHVGSVLGKLGAASRAEAVMLATRRGLLSV
ncbi:response regulator transcription factor [soil metagenome]